MYFVFMWNQPKLAICQLVCVRYAFSNLSASVDENAIQSRLLVQLCSVIVI